YGHDALVTLDESDKPSTIVVFDPTQVKSAIGNRGTFDPASSNILESRIETLTTGATADNWHPFAQRAHDAVFDTFAGGRTFGVWARTIGTQLAKARENAEYKRVFDRSQKFIDDISRYALRAEGLAPTILPKVGGLRDVPRAVAQAMGKGGMSASDNEWLARVLSEGTLAGEDTGKGPSPTEGRVWTDAELRSRFGATDAQIGMYREARAAIDQSLEDAGRATMLSTLRTARVDQDVVDRIEQQAQSLADVKREAMRVVEDMQFSAETDEQREAAERLAASIEDVETRVDELQRAGYAPLMRFGRFYLTAYEGDEVAYFGRFESMAELLREQRRLKEANKSLRFARGEMSQSEHTLFKGVDPHTVMLFAKEAGIEDEALQKWYELATADRSALKRLIHRKGTAGFSMDAKRTLAAFLTSNARYASSVVNIPAMKEAANGVRDGGVKDEALELVSYVTEPKEEAAKIRGLMFTWYLGGSLASGLVNLSQPVMMTLPYLSRFGVGNAAGALKDGMAAAVRSMRGQAVADKELARALELAASEGITDPSEIHNLMATSRGEFKTPLMQAFHTVWGANFAVTEAFNRKTTFAAAYLAARKAGEADPYAFAKQAIYDTQGLYSRANRPNWARGTIGATLFTFKQYSIAYIEFLKQLSKDGALPKQQVAVALGMLALAAGVQGLPGADDLDDLIDATGQWLGYGTNVRQWKRGALSAAFGETFANVALYGISTQLGVDVQARLGLGNLIPGTGMLVPSNPNKTRDLSELGGPVASLMGDASKAIERIFRGDLAGALTMATPLAARNAMKGGEMLATGEARDEMGRRVMDVSPAEALTKAVGFNPQRLASESRRLRDIRADENIVNSKAAEIRELWARGLANQDTDAARDAQDMLREWNARNPDMAIKVRLADVLKRARDMRRSREERFVRSVPESLRARARNEMDAIEE
ncbi:MAG TPA: PLxRFG domain-containing protein, partial [Burkholderiaceae bacterium]|nr:PLxRFG domain-containing protein [Burkholderiaceae bacterium]